ncbi:MAG: hypothetical protein BroJett011_43090 [Chloroflexota bacterium]|nr:MAG: hypothetical protein BroJett011_43090 [Chloroflexota bacterium]
MTTQSTPEQPRLYNLAEHDEYEVAAKIASEVIQTGESTGWSETELGEQNEIADILLYYNIYPGDQPGTWDFKPERPSLPLTTMLRNGLVRQGDFNEFLGGLNQLASMMQQFTGQASQFYAAVLIRQGLDDEAAVDADRHAVWSTQIDHQIAQTLKLPPFRASQLTQLTLRRLAGIPDTPDGGQMFPGSPELVMLARQEIQRRERKAPQHLAALEGYFSGEIDGETRCLHFTFENQETLVLDIFNSQAAATSIEAEAELIGAPIVINLSTGEVCSEPPLEIEPQ